MNNTPIDPAGFAQRLKQVIKTKAITQKKAADELQITRPQFTRYCNGQIPGPAILLDIIHWAGCSMQWLLTGEEMTDTERPHHLDKPELEKVKLKAHQAQTIELITEKIDAAVLGILFLTLHDETHAWKTIDWDILGRLHQQGLILNPRNKNKSVTFTERGLLTARTNLETLFGKRKHSTIVSKQ